VRKLALLVLLLVTHQAAAHVFILFDASFSMSLPTVSGSRAESALEQLPELFDRLGVTSASLFTLRSGAALEHAGEHESLRSVSTRIREERLFGRASPTRALFTLAARLGAAASESRVLLVTDAEELNPASAPLPSFAELVILHLDGPSPHSALDTPAFQDSRVHVVTVPTEDTPPASLQRLSEPSFDNKSLAAQPRGESLPHSASVGRSPVRFLLSLLLLLAAISTAALTAWLIREHVHFTRLLRRAREWNARDPEVSLGLTAPGYSQNLTLSSYPATVGFSPQDTLIIPGHYACTAFPQESRITITTQADRFVLNSTVALRVQGFLKEQIVLVEGLQLRLAKALLTVTRIERRRLRREPKPYHLEKMPWLIPAVLVLVLSPVVLGRFPVAHPQNRAVPADSAYPVRDARPAPVRYFDARPMPPASGRELPEVYSDTDRIPFFNADFVAIHAHPDDESLDFGALLAALDATGKRGVQILLTDGESGQDLYPARPLQGRYPGYRLRGQELASVRIAEARKALGWLGVEHYVRLSLPNHPYNTLLDEITPRRLLQRWGGEQTVAWRLAHLIEQYRPELLISPDGPSQVIEHFEHEATGLAVARALVLLDERQSNPVQTHLVSIDPLQLSGPVELRALAAWKPVTAGRDSPRTYQLHALAAHLTQLDAAVNGVETRGGLTWEYYHERVISRPFHALFPQIDLVPHTPAP